MGLAFKRDEGWKCRLGIIKRIQTLYVAVKKGGKNTEVLVLHALLGYDLVSEHQ